MSCAPAQLIPGGLLVTKSEASEEFTNTTSARPLLITFVDAVAVLPPVTVAEFASVAGAVNGTTSIGIVVLCPAASVPMSQMTVVVPAQFEGRDVALAPLGN